MGFEFKFVAGETKMKTNRPTFLQIVRGDSIFLLLMFGLGGSVLAIAFTLYMSGFKFQDTFSETVLLMFIPIFVLAFIFLVFRYKRITSIFGDGIEVSGTVTEVIIPGGDSQASPDVHFTYEFQGERFRSGNLTLEKKAKSLKVGQSEQSSSIETSRKGLSSKNCS